MPERQDALVAASRLTLAVREAVTSRPGRQVGTVGHLTVEPNAPNVIPGKVQLTIELRDLSPDVLTALATTVAHLGDTERATALFDEAQELADRCADPGVLPQRLKAARRAARVDRASGPEELSERELTVLRLLASDLSEREIAAELYLSFNTVHSHVKSIYRKLGVSSRAEAVEIHLGR